MKAQLIAGREQIAHTVFRGMILFLLPFYHRCLIVVFKVDLCSKKKLAFAVEEMKKQTLSPVSSSEV